jgi:hypothetical protein
MGMTDVSRDYVKREFDETLGYIRGDIQWLIDKQTGLNYTIALLVVCGCEMLAACLGDTNRHGETVFAGFLPDEWQPLAGVLYSALRDGLAHGFDTRHLLVDGEEHQIHLDAKGPPGIRFARTDRGIGLFIRTRSIADALCKRITDYEVLLQHDEAACHQFLEARQRPAVLKGPELATWRALRTESGVRLRAD